MGVYNYSIFSTLTLTLLLVDPCAHHSESGASVVNEILASDFKFICDSNGGSEATTIYIRFDDDSFGYGQFVYSSIGLSPSAQLVWRYWNANGVEVSASSSHSGSAFKLSPDKCSATLGPNSHFKHLPESDFPSYDISLFPKSSGCGVSLAFVSLTPAVQLKSGKTTFRASNSSSPFHFFHQFLPIGRVSGQLFMPGKPSLEVSGYATILRGLQSNKPHCIATRWDMFQLLDGPRGDAMILLQCKTPKLFSRQAITQSILVRGGRIICCSSRAYARHLDTILDASNGYELPSRVEYRMDGVGVDGSVVKAVSEVQTKVLTTKIDILAELPFLLRKLLQVLIAKPFTYLWWDRGSVAVEVGDDKWKMEGMVYHETTF
eukprot:Partr_v1_DN28720_c3_g3_i2_m62922 putative Survival factor 1